MTEPRPAGISTDLLAIIGLAAMTTIAILVPGVPWQIEWILSIPFLVVLPGYGVVAALFPRHPTAKSDSGDRGSGPNWAARAGLSVVLSAVLLAVVGVGLSVLGSLRLAPVILAVTGIIFGGTLVAFFRRQRVRQSGAVAASFSPSVERLPRHLGLSGPQSVLLGLATLALVLSVGFAAGTPGSPSTYSEVALLEEDGTLVGGDGTLTMVENEKRSLYLRLENHEGGPTTYTVIAQLQRVGENGGVIQHRRIGSADIAVASDETVAVEWALQPTLAGDRLRLRYLIYTGPVPEDPRPQNADLSLRVWVTVLEGNSS